MGSSTLMKQVGRFVLALALGLGMVAPTSVPAAAHGGGGYHHHGGGHYGYRYKKRRRNRDVALGVIGGVLALGTIAALANSNRGHHRGRRSYRGGGSCDYWADRCAQNWGTRNNNFYGCLRYHRCY